MTVSQTELERLAKMANARQLKAQKEHNKFLKEQLAREGKKEVSVFADNSEGN